MKIEIRKMKSYYLPAIMIVKFQQKKKEKKIRKKLMKEIERKNKDEIFIGLPGPKVNLQVEGKELE